jgi:Amt family ammonium transporter
MDDIDTAQTKQEVLGAALDAVTDAIAIVDRPEDGLVFRYVNPSFVDLFEFGASNVVGRPLNVLFGATTDRERAAFVADRAREGHSVRTPLALYARSGKTLQIEVALDPMNASDEEPLYVVVLRDVTARMKYETALLTERQTLRVTLASVADAVITTVADGRVNALNTSAEALLGISNVSAYGEPLGAVFVVDDTDTNAPMGDPFALRTARGVDVLEGIGSRLERNGDLRYLAYRLSPIRVGENDVRGFVLAISDVTADHRREAQLAFEATHDPLTQLWNRRRFMEALAEAYVATNGAGTPNTVAFLDLDRFKTVNDTAGHAVGDRVLAEVANVLRRSVREGDVLARLGGDEFGLVLRGCTVTQARIVLESIRLAVENYRYEGPGGPHTVGVSIGTAAITGATLSPEEALEQADSACYEVKRRGRQELTDSPRIATIASPRARARAY